MALRLERRHKGWFVQDFTCHMKAFQMHPKERGKNVVSSEGEAFRFSFETNHSRHGVQKPLGGGEPGRGCCSETGKRC